MHGVVDTEQQNNTQLTEIEPVVDELEAADESETPTENTVKRPKIAIRSKSETKFTGN